ncbi:MAG: Bacillopeptidase [Amycolatopsis sp.]|uniref:S8 family serine peptidase n=1 Tax=Amycolatopsis sp. TaxID=37632 RepID=UPI002618F793|nr:S8 family serine peptidase [Amycolatopsis sp.]MCU1679431.1 Bacillopeptidase [Amycolatopsis sp.]
MRLSARWSAAVLAALTASALVTDSASAAPAGGPDQSVIVELTGTPGASSPHSAAEIARSPVAAELATARDVHALGVVNAITATVTPQQISTLQRDPRVARIVPNALIKIAKPPARPTAAKVSAAAPNLPAGACAADGGVQLNPEAVSAIHAVSDDPAAKTARSLGATGAGVTVGDIAGSIDVDSPELIRPDGSHVIGDYRDFTGEGGAVESEDIESFLDDGMIAAQGRGVYDLADYTVHHLSQPCRIRLEGVAPQVNLTAYKVYAANDMTTTSAFLQAIDYAVGTDHVNVLNEEAGTFPMPDTSADLIKTANSNAMAAGVTITVPSYDSGLANTIWSPGSQPGVIPVGASTTFRSYAQTGEGGFSDIGATGWISDNISSLSSGGSTEQGRSIDVVAPGDLDWAICTADPKIAPDCLDDRGKPSGVVLSGGTSEAGPLVAGVAALVIQSYRATHGGATPAPALVSHLITSTSDDLGISGAQQGAGLVDAYRAVAAARSVPTSDAKPTAIGSNVIADTDQLDAIGAPGTSKQFSVTLTNAGATSTTVTAAGRTLSASRSIAATDAVISATGPGYLDARGNIKTYVKVPFDVPRGADRLDGDIAYPGGGRSIVDLALLDPQGRLAGYSLPEGQGNHGHVDVGSPLPGRWTAVMSATQVAVTGTVTGFTGAVHFGASVAGNRPLGTVTPNKVTLAPGQSAKVRVTAPLPAHPGDTSASLVLGNPGSPMTSIPMTLRSLVPFSDGVGRFSGQVVGGNGRTGTPAQTFFYNLDVPAGKPALDVTTALSGEAKDPYYVYLVAPDGQTAGQSSNQLLVGSNHGQPVTVGSPGSRVHTTNPAAGRWTVIITFTNPVVGDQLSTTLSGKVDFAPVAPKVTGLPTSGTLKAGVPQVVAVTVHNDSPAVESYFLDARLNKTTTTQLASVTPSKGLTLPLAVTAPIPQWIVPTDTTALAVSAASTGPVVFDTSPYNGEPDLGSTADGNQAFASLTAPAITPGNWQVSPQPAGAFGADPAPKSTVDLTVTATTKAFDADAQSPSGDLWRQTDGFAPVVVQPGRTSTLYLTIIPSAPSGTLVTGTLYLDDSTSLSQVGISPTGDQLAAMPYQYSVA